MAYAYVAKSAEIIGKVHLSEDVGVWCQSVIRADRDEVFIGKGSNIQDGSIIHMEQGLPVKIGEYVVVGHGAIIHGCEVGDGTLVGMRATILNGAKIGKNCIIGAGALVTQNKVIPDNSLVIGSPAKVLREVTPEEIQATRDNALEYIEMAHEQLPKVEI